MGDHVILLMTTLATHDLSFANQLELQQIYIEFRKMIQTQFSCSINFFFFDLIVPWSIKNPLFLSLQNKMARFSIARPGTPQYSMRAEHKHPHFLDTI